MISESNASISTNDFVRPRAKARDCLIPNVFSDAHIDEREEPRPNQKRVCQRAAPLALQFIPKGCQKLAGGRRPPDTITKRLHPEAGARPAPKSMASTFLSLHYHIIFSTKERRPLIHAEWRPSLHEYLGGTVRGLLGVPEAIGGIEDHVHILVGLKATHRLADFMRELKKASVWSIDRHDRLFAWQEGYAAFTVSPTNRDAVRAYIGRQAEHHKKLTFEEEIIELLEKAGVQYDPKYLA